MNLDTVVLSKYTTNRFFACHCVTSAFCSASRYVSVITVHLLEFVSLLVEYKLRNLHWNSKHFHVFAITFIIFPLLSFYSTLSPEIHFFLIHSLNDTLLEFVSCEQQKLIEVGIALKVCLFLYGRHCFSIWQSLLTESHCFFFIKYLSLCIYFFYFIDSLLGSKNAPDNDV